MSIFLVCRQKLIKGLGIFYLVKFWMFSLFAEFTIYLIWKLLLWKVLYVKRVCGLNLIGMRADTFFSFDQFLHAGIHKGLELKKLSPRDKLLYENFWSFIFLFFIRNLRAFGIYCRHLKTEYEGIRLLQINTLRFWGQWKYIFQMKCFLLQCL